MEDTIEATLFTKETRKVAVYAKHDPELKKPLQYLRMDTKQKVDPINYPHELEAVAPNRMPFSDWMGFIWVEV